MLQIRPFVNCIFLFIRDGSIEKPDYTYQIVDKEISTLDLSLNIFKGTWELNMTFEDDNEIFKGFSPIEFKTYVQVVSYGSSPEKTMGHYPLRVISVKRLENSRATEVSAVDPYFLLTTRDTERYSFKEGTGLISVLKKLISPFKGLNIDINLTKYKNTDFTLPYNLYYRGNAPLFLEKYILSSLDPFSVLYFSANKLYLQDLNILGEGTYLLFNQSKREGRKDTSSKFLLSDWFSSLKMNFNIDAYYIDYISTLNVKEATSTKNMFQDKDYTLTDPFYSRLNLKDEISKDYLHLFEEDRKEYLYESLKARYLKNTLEIALNINPFIVPNMVATIDTSIKGGDEMADYAYRGNCLIYEVRHSFSKETTNEQNRRIGTTFLKCIKSGFYSGDVDTKYSKNNKAKQPNSNMYGK